MFYELRPKFLTRSCSNTLFPSI